MTIIIFIVIIIIIIMIIIIILPLPLPLHLIAFLYIFFVPPPRILHIWSPDYHALIAAALTYRPNPRAERRKLLQNMLNSHNQIEPKLFLSMNNLNKCIELKFLFPNIPVLTLSLPVCLSLSVCLSLLNQVLRGSRCSELSLFRAEFQRQNIFPWIQISPDMHLDFSVKSF